MTLQHKFRISALVGILSLPAAGIRISCQNFDLIDSALTVLSNDQMFSGQVLIAENGKIQLSNSYGQSPLGTKQLTNSTSLDIASVSKTFTSAAIMILKERGLLDYDDILKTYYSQLGYDGITIRQILNHTSGLPNILGLIFEKLDHSKYFSNSDIIDLLLIHKPKLAFEPVL